MPEVRSATTLELTQREAPPEGWLVALVANTHMANRLVPHAISPRQRPGPHREPAGRSFTRLPAGPRACRNAVGYIAGAFAAKLPSKDTGAACTSLIEREPVVDIHAGEASTGRGHR